MQQKLINKFLLIAIVFALTSKMTFSQTIPKTDKNCGCDYFPMCNYTAKKQFGQDTYYGIKGSEKKGTYYICKNGTVTVKWFTEEDYLAERRWEWRSDINDYGYVDYYDTDTKINTKVLYKFNLPVGGEWKTSAGKGDFEHIYTIESKTLSISVNGKKFTNVLKLSQITKAKKTEQEFIDYQGLIYLNTFYDNGEVFKNSYDYYFDKNDGLIKEENTWDELKRKHVSRIDGITSSEQVYAFQLKYKMEKERVADSIESLKPFKSTHSFTHTLVNKVWAGNDSYVFLPNGMVVSAGIVKNYDRKTKSYNQTIKVWGIKGKWKIIDCNDCASDIDVIVQVNWYNEETVISQSRFNVMFNGRDYHFGEMGVLYYARPLSNDLKKAVDDYVKGSQK